MGHHGLFLTTDYNVWFLDLKTLFCLVFPEVFLVFFGCLWYCWFSRSFFWFSKNHRENQKYQRQPQKAKKTFGKTKQPKFLKVSDPPLDIGLVLFVFFWFSLRFLENQKTFGKTKKPKRQNPYPRVGLKPLTTLFFWFSRSFFWCSFVFLVLPKVFWVF